MDQPAGASISSSSQVKNSDASPSSKPSTQPSKKSFASINLNSRVKAPSSNGRPNNEIKAQSSSKLHILGKSKSSAPNASVPAPLNTPSLRQENDGQDINTQIVAGGGATWGANNAGNTDKGVESNSKQADAAPKSDCWAKEKTPSPMNSVKDSNGQNESSPNPKSSSDSARAVEQSSDKSFERESGARYENLRNEDGQRNRENSSSRNTSNRYFGYRPNPNNYDRNLKYGNSRNKQSYGHGQQRNYNAEMNDYERANFVPQSTGSHDAHTSYNPQQMVEVNATNDKVNKTDLNYRYKVSSESSPSRDTSKDSTAIQVAADPYSLVVPESNEISPQTRSTTSEIAGQLEAQGCETFDKVKIVKPESESSVGGLKAKVEKGSDDTCPSQPRGSGQIYDYKTGKLTTIDNRSNSDSQNDERNLNPLNESGQSVEKMNAIITAGNEKEVNPDEADWSAHQDPLPGNPQIELLILERKKRRQDLRSTREPRTSGVLYSYNDKQEPVFVYDNPKDAVSSSDPFDEFWSELYEVEENWRARNVSNHLLASNEKGNNDNENQVEVANSANGSKKKHFKEKTAKPKKSRTTGNPEVQPIPFLWNEHGLTDEKSFPFKFGSIDPSDIERCITPNEKAQNDSTGQSQTPKNKNEHKGRNNQRGQFSGRENSRVKPSPRFQKENHRGTREKSDGNVSDHVKNNDEPENGKPETVKNRRRPLNSSS